MNRLIVFLSLLLTCAGASAQNVATPEFSIDLSQKKNRKTFSASNAGEKRFELRGTKGFFWRPEQHLAEIPTLKEYRMNFMMVCYGSFYKDYAFEKGYTEWREPLSEEQRGGWKKVIDECRRNGIDFCFGVNPMLYSSRPLDTSSDEDFETLLSLYGWFQAQGVEWFYIPIDDVHMHKDIAIEGRAQALFVNRLYDALRKNDPQCKLIFCPSWYWGSTIDDPAKVGYLQEIGEYLSPGIFVFWTGNDVVSRTVTVADALRYKNVVKHELILWDNYPVNDFNNSLHLGPITGRDPELAGVIYGMISNPMRDNEFNRLPLFTMADYMYNPANYDPSRSIAQAIKHIARNRAQEQALADLVMFYPGDITYGSKSTRLNCARAEFTHLLKGGDAAGAAGYMERLKSAASAFDREFPSRYDDTKKVITTDLEWMKEQLK